LATANKLPINESKTKALLITGKRLASKLEKEMHACSLNVNGTELDLSSSVKLLGLEIDSELSFNNYIDKLCSKLSQRISMQQRLLYY